MIENELISKIIKISTICGWITSPVTVEAVEESDNEIYVSCDIHDKNIEEYTLYSDLSAIIEEAQELFGSSILSYEVMKNSEGASSRYTLQLHISTEEAEG